MFEMLIIIRGRLGRERTLFPLICFAYFPLGFTNGSGFNDPLLARDYASLVRGEASLEILKKPVSAQGTPRL